MRLVFDTNIVVAGIRSPRGASAELLRRVRSGGVRLLASVPLFVEYEAVATRPEHLRAAGASIADIAAVLDALASLAEPVDIAYLWRPQLRDASDDMVLEAAANGRGRAIVTFNTADFDATPSRFGIDVMSPSETLRSLG